MKFVVKDDHKTYQELYQAVYDIQSAKVWPYPGVVQETLATRGVEVDLQVDEGSSETVVHVVRKGRNAS
jgi:hypothetical protein